jgi:hypothetical protein
MVMYHRPDTVLYPPRGMRSEEFRAPHNLMTRRRIRFRSVALVAVLVASFATLAAKCAPTASGLSVYVGYAENKEITTPDPASFPVPWAGSPNTIFLGGTIPGQAACGSFTACYDTGAIRLDNPTDAPITVSSVSVDDHSSVPGGQVFDNLWGSFTVPAGKSAILAANPPANNPGYDNFDTSSFPDSNCTPLTVPPTVTITVNGVATTLKDTTHVLDTGGIDAGSCNPPVNESIQWRPIGWSGSNSASISLAPSTSTVFAGTSLTEQATVLDGSGNGLQNASVAFSVTSGPNAGTSGSAVTDADGHASFTYSSTSEGEDTVVATVTSIASFQSNTARIMWVDDATTGWTSNDIGAPTPAGSDTLQTSTGTWTVQGGGNGVGGMSDQFHLLSKPLAAHGGVAARVVAQTSAATNAEAGVMLRTDSSATAPYYAAFVTPGAGVTIVDRPTTGAATATLTSPGGAVPAYLWVGTTGAQITAYGSTDGYVWTPIPGSTATLNLGSTPLAGLAVSSRDPAHLNAATMDSVVVTGSPPGPMPPVPCPSPWTCADIGNPAPAGSQSFDPNTSTWTISGGGADIYGTADQFRFVSRTVSGDASISAHVVSQTNSDVNAKAGLMLRAGTDPGAPNYAVVVTPTAGIKVQVRTTQGGGSSDLANPPGIAPAWLKVTRVGNTFTAYTSNDGVTWTPIAGTALTMTMPASLLEGMAVNSHSNGTRGTATFNNVVAG